MSEWEHEDVVIRQGPRSGAPVIVAVHSTASGPAVGGCRMWHYPHWRDGLDDALRLSRAMTHKCAAAGLDNGGGKAVVPLAPNTTLSARARRELLLDLGDVVASLAGRYSTGEDVGTTAADMLVVSERTSHVFCLPEDHGGIGEPAEPTAAGVHAALQATCRQMFGSGDLGPRRFAIHGLGQVGGRLARWLAAAGADLIVADTEPERRDLAAELGAQWAQPQEVLHAQADMLVPASLGGLLTPDVVAGLRCRAVVGPANNQLASDPVADQLASRGILWAPDVVVNAGGVIYGVSRELDGATHETAMARVGGIADTLDNVFATASRDGLTPHQAVSRMVQRRLQRSRAAKGSKNTTADTEDFRIEVERPDTVAGQHLLGAYAGELDQRLGTLDERRSSSIRGDEELDVPGHATSDELSPPRGVFLIAYRHGRPVGCAGLRTLDHGLGEIKRMYVAPEVRGSGCAKRLLQELEARARTLGHQRLRLDTAANMPEARALYQSTGYRTIPDYNANTYAAHWFEKDITTR